MENNLNICCDYEFLRKFYNSCPQVNNIEERSLFGFWKNLDDLMCKHSTLLIWGIDNTDFGNSKDGTDWDLAFDALLKRWADGGELVCLPKERAIMEMKIEDDEGHLYFKDMENRIFLFDKNAEYCNKMENDYGLMFISSDNFLQKCSFLFSSSISSINSLDNTKDWKFLSRFRHPCNYIKIIDSYLFKNQVSDNIYDILLALLPKELNKEKFLIEIVTNASEYDDKIKHKRRTELNDVIKKLELQLLYEIVCEVHFVHGKLHDRYLLTNYSIITCGYGFNLKESERKTGTHLTFFPITYLQMPNHGYSDNDENSRSDNPVFKLMKKIGELK